MGVYVINMGIAMLKVAQKRLGIGLGFNIKTWFN
jgi:hypothetical protein